MGEICAKIYYSLQFRYDKWAYVGQAQQEKMVLFIVKAYCRKKTHKAQSSFRFHPGTFHVEDALRNGGQITEKSSAGADTWVARYHQRTERVPQKSFKKFKNHKDATKSSYF